MGKLFNCKHKRYDEVGITIRAHWQVANMGNYEPPFATDKPLCVCKDCRAVFMPLAEEQTIKLQSRDAG